MSLSIYSAQSAEANRLRYGEFEIYYDQKNDKVIIKTGKEKVYFNTLYNKEEVDQLIAQGVDPSTFENWIFNRVMLYSFATGSAIGVVSLKELLDYLSRDMQALNVIMNEKVDSRNVVDFNEEVKPAENKIYNASSIYDFLILLLIKLIKRDDVVAYNAQVEPAENQIYNALSMHEVLKEVLTTSDLVLWDQNVKPEKAWNVYNAQSLWDKITSIKECHCDPNLMDFLRELKQISTIDPPTAIGNLKSFVLRGNIKAMGAFMCSNLPMKSNFIKRPDLPTEVNEEENDYNAVNDYEPFDPDNPVYGTFYLPCCLDVTGTINGIHTKDILTKDDIDDFGASHFMTVEGAPPFTISNDCLTFESVLDGSIADRITFTFNEDVMTYLKTLSTETNVIEIRFRKLQVYDIDGNLVSKTYIKYNSSTWTVFNLAKNEQGVLQIHFETTETPQLTAYESAELLLKDIYTEGVMMFSYALSETCIQSDRDVVKCNIIDAKNAFKLIETDQLYLYEPTVIDEKTIGDVDYWYQLYHIDPSTNIINDQKFELSDHYTGFSFELQWSSEENKWKGFNNVHSTRFVSGGVKDTDMPQVCQILIQKSDIHELWFSSLLDVIDVSKNWVEELWTKEKIKFILEAPDGTQTDITNICSYESSRTDNINGKTYYRGNIDVHNLKNVSGITEKHLIFGLICINEDSISRLEWKAYNYTTPLWGGKPVSNIAEQLNLRFGVELTNTTGNTKDIELFIRKDVIKIDSTLKAINGNIFDAINRKKYYQVKPYPESCSTLYTDLCIQSSKIITADNITTMAADLNYIQNFSYDLEAMIESVNNKLNTFVEELKEQQEKTASINALIGGFMIIPSGLSLIGNIMGSVGELSFLAEEGMEIGTSIRANTSYIRIVDEAEHEMETEVFPFNIFDRDESSVETNIDYSESNTDIDWNDFNEGSNDLSAKTKLVFKDWVSLTPKTLSDGTVFYTEEKKSKYENHTVSMTGTLRLINTLQQWTADYINALHKRIRPMEHIFANCTPVKIIDQKCLIKNDNVNLFEADLINSVVKVTSIAFQENQKSISITNAEKEIAIEAKTLVLNKLMIENLADEQLLIKNEVSNVLFSLSEATFENPVAIHDTLTVTQVVCDDLKNSSDKKYITEDDIDVDIMKDVIKVLQDDRIQITCTQLHCDLITNTAFEPYALEKNHYTKTEADEKFALKNELSAPDTSNYLEKRLLSWDINDSRDILKLGYCGKEDGTQFYIEDNFQGDDVSGWYITAYKDNLYFKQNIMNSMFKTIEFRYNGIFFEGNKLITESEADEKYVLKSELTQYATAQSELDEYVATETLEDVVSQINSKFDSQKRRWTFKLTMNANTNTTTLNLSESIDQYNPVLSNSDGKHVFTYQETNNGFEMIVLTVTLSDLTLSVQADKPSKNKYDVYLSFDEL